jgi:hypothetical protein
LVGVGWRECGCCGGDVGGVNGMVSW